MVSPLTPEEQAEVRAALHDPRKRLGSYVLMRELGRGGMGVVFKAFDTRVERLVAIKHLLDVSSGRRTKRFMREARLTGQLGHPAIPAVHEVVSEGPGAPYLVMEFVRGTSLEDLWGEDSPRPDRETLARVASEVCDALTAAHSEGVVHRDLKPPNVMLAEDGRALVLDFGVAKDLRAVKGESITRTGSMVGTPAYMPPEQITNAKGVAPAADIYGVGGILYYGLTGLPPFQAMHPMAVIGAIKTMAPDPPSEHAPTADPDLERICLRCLEKDPADRYSDAEALARDLREVLEGRSPLVPQRRRGVRLGLWAGVVLLATAGSLGVLLAAWPGEENTHADRGPESPAAAVAQAETPDAPAEDDTPPEVQEGGRDMALSWLKLARGRLDSGEHREAVADATRALEADETLAAAYALRGEAQEKLGDREAAQRDLARAEELDPGAASARADRGEERSPGEPRSGERQQQPTTLEGWIDHGHRLRRMGQLSRALRAFEYAGRLDGSRWEPYMGRGLCLLDQRNYGGAIAAFDRAHARAPRVGGVLARRGFAKYRLKDHQGAVQDFTLAIELEPEEPKHYRNRGVNLSDLGDYELSLADVERAIALGHPDLGECYSAKGFSNFKLGHHAKAVEDFTRAIEQADDRWPYWVSRARNRSKTGDLPGAVADMSRAISLDPSRLELYEIRAEYKELAGDAAGARADLARASKGAPGDRPGIAQREDDPSTVKGWLARADKEGGRRQYAQALASCNRALALDDESADVHALRGWVLHRQKRFREAIADYTRAIELEPENGKHWQNRGINHSNLDQEERAALDLQRALDLGMEDVDLDLALGRSLGYLGRYKEAGACLDAALRKYPDHVPSLLQRGFTHFKLREFSEAISVYGRVTKLDPQNPRGWLNRAVNFMEHEQWAAAIDDLDQVIALNPGSASGWHHRGNAYFRLGKFEEAIRDGEQALRKDPRSQLTRALLEEARRRQNEGEGR